MDKAALRGSGGSKDKVRLLATEEARQNDDSIVGLLHDLHVGLSQGPSPTGMSLFPGLGKNAR